MIDYQNRLNYIINALPQLDKFHHRHGFVYSLLDDILKEVIIALYGEHSACSAVIGDAGSIVFPYVTMGAINSTHLFGLDEIIIFSYYMASRGRYKTVYDVGANIGLHSIILAKLGYDVVSYEPDPLHFAILQKNLLLNGVQDDCTCINKAVSTSCGDAEFIRVLGNTTSSHIAGAKNPYGLLDKFKVEVDAFLDIMKDADLIKLDVEGHESDIILSTNAKSWENVDAIVEIGTSENSYRIFNHMIEIGVNMFSQKKSWDKVSTIEDMPVSYKEGSLFITGKNQMFW